MHRLESLSLENIEFGRALAAMNEAIWNVAEDVVKRGRVETARTVTLTVKIAPEVDESGSLNTPNISWTVAFKLPGRTGLNSKGIVVDGRIEVNVDDPNPMQTVLFAREPENIQKLPQTQQL